MDDEGLHIEDLPPLTHHDGSVTRSPFEWAVMVMGIELAIVNLGLGLSLLMSAPARFSAASFEPLKHFMPMEWWGVVFLATGVMAVVAQALFRMGVVALTHGLAGFSCLFWTVAFTIGLSNPNASATGIWAYLGLGLTHWVIAGVSAVKAQRVHQKRVTLS